MKRLVSLAAILLALTMVLSLAACGDDTQPEEGTNEATNSQTGETNQPAAVDLAALRTQIISDCAISDYLEVETEGLTTAYGIDAAQVASSASFNATNGAAFPDEIVMVQAVDEAAAADVAAKLENHLDYIAETAASYDPDSLALAEKCEVVTDGVYVGMFFSSHYDDMVAAFQSAIG